MGTQNSSYKFTYKFTSIRRHALASVACTALMASAAHAQSLQTWLNQKTMTGNWNGARTKLEGIGIDLHGGHVGEFADVMSGGKRQGNGYAQQLYYGMTIDLGKLAGLNGTVLNLSFNTREGRNASADFIGNKLAVQEVYGAGETTRLTELSIEQALFDKMLMVKLGLYPMGNDFGSTPIGCDFQNVGFCAHPQNLPNSSGWADNPTGHWGARVKLNVTPALYGEVGVYDVNPTYGSPGNGLKISTSGSTGALIPAEIGYTTAFGAAELPGHYKVGVYYDTSKVADAVTPNQLDKGRYGAYILADQMLFSFDGTAKRGLVGFAQYSVSDARTAVFANTIAAGLVALGPFDSRPHDYLNAAYVRAGINHRNIAARQAALAAQNITTPSLSEGEGLVEVGYGLAATPWLLIHPNVQYVINPGTFSYKHIPNAWVFGFETKVTF
ncbi:MAG: carbohydrate porin [Acidocella sp.]|nr:carbohydrate porin [Acidocella sp.]